MKVLVLFLFLTIQCHAQMILNDFECRDNANLIFNKNFISQHKIKSIKGRLTVKRHLAQMKEMDHFVEYFFDENGRVLSNSETLPNGDVLWRKYFYNDKGNLIYQSYGDRYNFEYSTYLLNDSLRVLVKNDFERKTDERGIPNTKEVKKEYFMYDYTDSTCAKTIKNSSGTPYMKEVEFLDYNGRISRKEYRYITTGEGSISSFKYDAKGRLIDVNTVSSKQGVEMEKYVYKYDKAGNLKEKKYFQKGSRVYEKQYIVNETNGLLSAVIDQYGEDNTLNIFRFQTYEYFD